MIDTILKIVGCLCILYFLVVFGLEFIADFPFLIRDVSGGIKPVLYVGAIKFDLKRPLTGWEIIRVWFTPNYSYRLEKWEK